MENHPLIIPVPHSNLDHCRKSQKLSPFVKNHRNIEVFMIVGRQSNGICLKLLIQVSEEITILNKMQFK